MRLCAACRATHSFQWAALSAGNIGKDVPDPCDLDHANLQGLMCENHAHLLVSGDAIRNYIFGKCLVKFVFKCSKLYFAFFSYYSVLNIFDLLTYNFFLDSPPLIPTHTVSQKRNTSLSHTTYNLISL